MTTAPYNDQNLFKVTRRRFIQHTAVAAGGVLLGGCAVSRPARTEPQRSAQPEPPAADWPALADAALATLRQAGVDYGDVRIVCSRRQVVRGRDGHISGISDGQDCGFGVRVLDRGAWGFGASPVMTPDEARRVARLAVEIARASAALMIEPVTLAPEPVHRDTVRTAFKTDPFEVSLDQKSALLLAAMDAMGRSPGIVRTDGHLWAQRDRKLIVTTEGSHLRFDLLAVHGRIRATAVHDGRFASRSFLTPYLRTGYELIEQQDLVGQAPRVAAEALEKVRAPLVRPGTYDLVLDPAHLALTIHESCGHPTELDRALGYEANYAGTSFLTPDKLGHFQYGSKHVNLVADNTLEGGLASTGYDDDAVECQRWDIIREGVFVGYSDNREVAPKIGLKRSHGCCRADGWSNIPIVRIANVCLMPGAGSVDDLIADVKRGIYIEGRGSYSIDQKRYNFQFGGDAFWLIENGKRTHMLRDVIYTGITPEFWRRCDAVGGPGTFRKYGFITCGKGQPGQSGWMTHAAAAARFRNVQVIAGKT